MVIQPKAALFTVSETLKSIGDAFQPFVLAFAKSIQPNATPDQKDTFEIRKAKLIQAIDSGNRNLMVIRSNLDEPFNVIIVKVINLINNLKAITSSKSLRAFSSAEELNSYWISRLEQIRETAKDGLGVAA